MTGSDFVIILSGSEIVCNVRGGVVRVLHNAREGREIVSEQSLVVK